MLAPLFPIKLEPDSNNRMGWRASKSHSKSFESAIRNMVNTKMGTFVRQEYYGVRVSDLLELPNDDLVAFLIYRYVKEAFEEFEPRGVLKDISLIRQGTGVKMKFIVKDKSENIDKEFITDEL